METAVAPLPPAPEEPLAPKSLGGLLELLFFVLAAVGLFLLVQFLALFGLVFLARQENPALSLGALLKRIGESIQYDAFFLVPVQVAFNLVLLLVLYAFVRLRRGLPFWEGLAVRPLEPPARAPLLIGGWLFTGALFALAVNLVGALVPPPEELPINRLFSSRAAFWLIFFAAVFVAPFVEELVFRGYIYTLLERLWGRAAAVLASGILFGAIHIPQLSTGSLEFRAVFPVLVLCAVGIFFSLVRARSGTTLASMLVHFSYNATLTLGFLFSPQYHRLASLF